MMAALTNEAQGQLERYLRQVRSALSGHSSVDALEVERDIRGHIDAELAGKPEPVDSRILSGVLERLGAPDQWVPADELPVWRRVLHRLHSGPEDWRLPYLSLILLFSQPILFFLGPLPMVASFIVSRATLSLMAERGDPIGARRWLIYPALLVWYVPALIFLAAWPIGIAAGISGDNPALREWVIARLPGPAWLMVPAILTAALCVWWVLLGVLCLLATRAVTVVFAPFAEWFERRHARRIVYAGILLAIVAGLVLTRRGPLALVYFFRVEPEFAKIEAGRVSEQIYDGPTCESGVLFAAAERRMTLALEIAAIDALDHPIVWLQVDAVRTLGAFGSANAQQPLWDAFEQWHRRWRDFGRKWPRLPGNEITWDEALGNSFAEAMARGRAWHLDQQSLARLRALCLTWGCDFATKAVEQAVSDRYIYASPRRSLDQGPSFGVSYLVTRSRPSLMTGIRPHQGDAQGARDDARDRFRGHAVTASVLRSSSTPPIRRVSVAANPQRSSIRRISSRVIVRSRWTSAALCVPREDTRAVSM